MSHFEKDVACEEVYSGRIFDVKVHRVTLENGAETGRDVIYHHGGVCIVALDEQDNILLVKQFRFPTGRELLELPAGKLEKGENPMQAALRELEEETGYITDVLSPLTEMYPTPAYCTEKIHIFTSGELRMTQQCLDEDEFLSVVRVPFNEAVMMVLSGEIIDAKTQVGILMLHAQRKQEAN